MLFADSMIWRESREITHTFLLLQKKDLWTSDPDDDPLDDFDGQENGQMGPDFVGMS